MANVKTELTAERRELIAQLLADATAAQDVFWEALSALESEIGDCDELGTADLSNYDVDLILELAEGEDNG